MVENGPDDGRDNAYRRDLLTSTTALNSQNRFLTGPANQGVHYYSTWASADGRMVAFATGADDVVEGDDKFSGDAFVWRDGLPPHLSILVATDTVAPTWLRALEGFKWSPRAASNNLPPGKSTTVQSPLVAHPIA